MFHTSHLWLQWNATAFFFHFCTICIFDYDKENGVTTIYIYYCYKKLNAGTTSVVFFLRSLRESPDVLRVLMGGGPRVVVSTAALHVKVRSSVPGLGGLKKNKNVSSPSTCTAQYCGEPPWTRGSVLGLRPPGLEFCVWRAVSSHSSHHPQDILLAKFSLYVHKGGLNPDSFHLHSLD